MLYRGVRSVCHRSGFVRGFRTGTKTSTPLSHRSAAAILAGGAGLATGVYLWHKGQRADNNRFPIWFDRTALAATKVNPQDNVYSQTKKHALYLWIHLKQGADPKRVAKVVAGLQGMVDTVVPAEDRDEESEIWAGVGFGPEFYQKISSKKPKNYVYPHRVGPNGDLPSSGGDIFIHAKSDEMSSLFHLAQVVQQNLKDDVKSFRDVYSFVYRNGRDLSGFIDGTENKAADDDRYNIAVEKETGGSYCITQRWIHHLDYIANEKPAVLESFVGRQLADSVELKNKPKTSHVARMTSGEGFSAKKPFEIVRQSMPYGTVGGEAGLFFIAFAEDPKNFEYMLDRMVGKSDDRLHDNIMKLTTCVAGNYWYFPSKDELKKFA